MNKLKVYINELEVGELTRGNTGKISFTYSTSYLESKNPFPLSQSMPLRKESFRQKECQPFFAGLLPEQPKRSLVAQRFGISPNSDYEMLARIGMECAGTVVVAPSDESNIKRTEYQVLDEKELYESIKKLPEQPLILGDSLELRLSMAGVQDKMLVHIDTDAGKISLPIRGSTSTHIIKPTHKRYDNLVYNEALCLELSKSLKIPTANCKIGSACGMEYLLVKRYDRAVNSSGHLIRIHQEDFCQAMGIHPDMKYQSYDPNSPSLKKCFNLVRSVSTLPALDLYNLLNAVLLNIIIGNCDAHGKNFSLIYVNSNNVEINPENIGFNENVPMLVRFAPLYDLVSTVYYSDLTDKMAMKLGGEGNLHKLRLDHFDEFAKNVGFNATAVRKRIIDITKKVEAELPKLKDKYKKVEDLIDLIKDRAKRLRNIVSH